MKMKLFQKDVTWGYISYALNSGINIILLPFMLIYLSSNELGLWYNFAAIGALVGLLDFGFLTTMTRNVSYSWNGAQSILKIGVDQNTWTGKPNIKLFAKILIVSKKYYLLIAGLAFLLLATFGSVYVYKISNAHDILNNSIFHSWFVYSIAIFFNIYYSYWTPFLKGIGEIKKQYQLNVYSKITQLIITVFTLSLGFGLLGVCLSYLGSVIILRILSKKIFYNLSEIKKINNEMRSFIPSIEKSEIKDLFTTLLPSIYKQGSLSISNYMVDKTSVLICTSVFGLSIASQLGLTLQIFGLISTISNVMFNTYLPKMIKEKAAGNYLKSLSLLLASIKTQFIILLLGFITISIFGNFIIDFIGSETSLLNTPQILLISIYFFIFNTQLYCINYIIIDNKFPMIRSYIITGLSIVICQYFLAINFKVFGVTPIIVSQIVILLLYNFWKWPTVILNEHNLKIKSIFLFKSLKN